MWRIVRSTGRLTDSAVVLAADDQGPDLQIQRLMRRAGRAGMPSRPILEVNPRHKLIESLMAKQDDKDWLVKTVAGDAAGSGEGTGGRGAERRGGLRAPGQRAVGGEFGGVGQLPAPVSWPGLAPYALT